MKERERESERECRMIQHVVTITTRATLKEGEEKKPE